MSLSEELKMYVMNEIERMFYVQCLTYGQTSTTSVYLSRECARGQSILRQYIFVVMVPNF